VIGRGTGLSVAALLVVALAGCGSTPRSTGGTSHYGATSTTAPISQATEPVVHPPAGEAAYKAAAQAVTTGELVNGPVNAPGYSVGLIVTFSGVIQSVLSNSTGQASGLILDDSASTSTICIRLSSEATSLKETTPNFMTVKDAVTVWGEWDGPASVASYPAGSTMYPAVVSEMYLTDTTTGQSDDPG
jgi:hypothetical protein